MRLLMAFLLMSFMSVGTLFSAISSLELKGMMVQRITSFIEWPNCAKENVVLAVYDDDASFEKFKKIFAAYSINGRNVQVKIFQNSSELSTLSACDILCISGASQIQKTKVMEKISKAGVLVIGSSRDDIRYGASMVLLEDSNRFKILINPEALKEAHLKADYRLLKLAEIVEAK